MNNNRVRPSTVVGLVCLTALASGCYSMNHTQSGALLGTGLGAFTGAAIGQHSGNTGTGALIGGLAGGLGGAIIGNAEDAREERDAALAYAHHSQAAMHAERVALTNADIIRMSQSGVGDQVIVNAIRTRGGRFDTSPEAIVSLKQNLVSDPVIQAMQTHTLPATAYAAPPPGPVIVTPPPPILYDPYPPPPAFHGHIIFGPRHPHRRFHRRHGWWRH